MRRRVFMRIRGLACCAVIVLFTGCVTYKLVGRYDAYNQIFEGTVHANLLAGGGKVFAASRDGRIKCEGASVVKSIPNIYSCAGQSGEAPLECSDGRRILAEWTATSCTTGYGHGKDDNGAEFRFVFGLSDEEAETELDRQAKLSSDLPAYSPKEVRARKGFATGTGFFVTDDGVCITNQHVVDGAKEVLVQMPGGSQLPARILVSDPANDVAVLKVDTGSTPIPLAPHFRAAKGEDVLTLGFPLIDLQGQELKVTLGHVNALSGLKDDVRLAQIDVPVQPGNSGGPLLTRRGEVVGVVSATLDQFVALRTSGVLPQNVNFAVKIDYILPALRTALGREIQGSPSVPETREPAEVVRTYEGSVVLVISK